MDYHKNARTVLWSREQMCRQVIERGWTLAAAAAAANVSAKTASKWVQRFRQFGSPGLVDRTCRPHRLHRPTGPEKVQLVETLRRQRWTGLRIAQQTGLSRATVSRILRRLKLSRMRDLEPCPPVQRYEHVRAGDMLHLESRSSGASQSLAIASPATWPTALAVLAGTTYMWPSTITPGSPFRPYSPTKQPSPPSPSSGRHWLITCDSVSISGPC